MEELFGQDAYYGLLGAARIGCAMGGAQWLIESLQPKPDASEEEIERLEQHIRSLVVAAEAVGEAEASTTPRDGRYFTGFELHHFTQPTACDCATESNEYCAELSFGFR